MYVCIYDDDVNDVNDVFYVQMLSLITRIECQSYIGDASDVSFGILDPLLSLILYYHNFFDPEVKYTLLTNTQLKCNWFFKYLTINEILPFTINR